MDLKETRSMLETVETVVSETREKIKDEKSAPFLILDKTLDRVARIAWAIKEYPIFDPSCLSRMKEAITEKMAEGLEDKKGFVPYFAWYTGFPLNQDSFNPTMSNKAFCSGVAEIVFDGHLIAENSNRGVFNIMNAQPPTFPMDVTMRVDKVKGKFDHVVTVWEAEWLPAPNADPLVIGVIGDTCFLIDRFDLTKMEHYIASEFTKKED